MEQHMALKANINTFCSAPAVHQCNYNTKLTNKTKNSNVTGIFRLTWYLVHAVIWSYVTFQLCIENKNKVFNIISKVISLCFWLGINCRQQKRKFSNSEQHVFIYSLSGTQQLPHILCRTSLDLIYGNTDLQFRSEEMTNTTPASNVIYWSTSVPW